jgi:hypothetical protein
MESRGFRKRTADPAAFFLLPLLTENFFKKLTGTSADVDDNLERQREFFERLPKFLVEVGGSTLNRS